VLRSEIPQLEVITAIVDAESEDFLSQLLFSQGWNIIYRAIDADSLRLFMKTRSAELRTVIIYLSNFPGLLAGELEEMGLSSVTAISIDGIPINSHLLMTHIRGKLRSPMIREVSVNQDSVPDYSLPRERKPLLASEHPRELSEFGHEQRNADEQRNAHEQRSGGRFSETIPSKRVIAITGTAGSPGRTRFALLLAEEFANSQRVLIVDADIRSQGLRRQRDQILRPEIDVLSLNVESHPTEIPDNAPMTIVDMGTMPVMAEAVTDRRWQGSLINNILTSATHLVYLCKSTQVSMSELSQFLHEYPLLLKKVPVTYICILAGHSRELRQWEGRFLTLTEGENRQIIREAELNPQSERALLPFLKPGNSKRREIAKIVNRLR